MISAIEEIQIVPGSIKFNQYEQLKEQATELATYINEIEVNEENIKYSKRLLAAVNKRVKEIEDRRIAIKKEILSPYHDFESCVKEIVQIVKDADNVVRNQVKELEEHERELKRVAIRDIFEKRVKHYFFKDVFKFENFIKPNHLNKSVSMNAIEKELVDWLEKIEADILVINSLPNAEAILTEYYDTKDLSTAIKIVNDYEHRKNNVVELVQPEAAPKKTVKTIIELEDENDLSQIETFLRFSNIKYLIKKVEK